LYFQSGPRLRFFSGRADFGIEDRLREQQHTVADYGSGIVNAFRDVENALTNERVLGDCRFA